jgi:hypothetical protein
MVDGANARDEGFNAFLSDAFSSGAFFEEFTRRRLRTYSDFTVIGLNMAHLFRIAIWVRCFDHHDHPRAARFGPINQ